MLLLIYLHAILWLPMLRADLSARLLDSLLQDYAFRSLVRPRTGVVYGGGGAVPSNLTGIQFAAVRLRSGSLRRRGIDVYKEFQIPIGIIEQPYVERIVLVYHNLANWSSLYYPLPGYAYLAPVLGILAYNASDLSTTNVPELDIRASENPILIRFGNVKLGPDGSYTSPKCVYFGLDGSLEFDNVLNGNVCSVTNQGHFSIVVEIAAAPSPAPPRKGKDMGWIIGGCVVVVVVVVVVVLLGVLVVCVKKCRRRKGVNRMEEAAAEGGVPLSLAAIGSGKVAVAIETRTRPVLENEYPIEEK